MAAPTSTPLVSFDRVSFCYGAGEASVLRDVSFSIAPGSFTAIVGPSGGGKSTLLSLVAGLERPTKGTVENRARTRMVFQSGALLPWRTALENVELGLSGRKVKTGTERHLARSALADLGIAELADEYPRNLSGGQRQRVGIARALVAEPELLILDEPFSALDAETSAHLVAEVEQLYEKKTMTFLMVSHSVSDAVLLADLIFVVGRGGIVETVPVPIARPRRENPEAVHIEARVKEAIARISPREFA